LGSPSGLLAPSHRVTRQCRLGLPSALGSGSPQTRRWRKTDSNLWSHLHKGQPFPNSPFDFRAGCTGCEPS
jgi:hypothetical protein